MGKHYYETALMSGEPMFGANWPKYGTEGGPLNSEKTVNDLRRFLKLKCPDLKNWSDKSFEGQRKYFCMMLNLTKTTVRKIVLKLAEPD